MVFAMTVSMATRAVATIIMAAIIATIATIRTFIVAAFVAHVVTQRTTRAATGGCADQAAGVAADATADHVAACCADTATDGSFCAVTTIRTHGRATCAAQASANRCACAAANLLADN